MVFWTCLMSLFLWFRVSPANADEWKAVVPQSVVGLSGSCVLIPCTFSYPSNGKTYTEFTGIWYTENYESKVYHTDTSEISDAFKGRTSLIGDLHQNNCSLNISSLSSSDNGSFMFRIVIKDLDKYTYVKNKVSIIVKETPETPSISVEEEVTSGKPVTATCAVFHSCPSDLPHVTWSHDGTHLSPSQPQNHGQWNLTSYSLTFTPSREDHNKSLSCSAQFKGKRVIGCKTLKVKYPPYNVSVVTGASVKENDSVELTCSSDSNPPANSYQWFSSNGTMLAKGPTYKLERVSRHTEAISCTANNTEGNNSSGPRKLNILYPPEIKGESSCQSENLTVCVCIVDSNPPSEVMWFGPNSSKAFSSTSIKQNESLTISTLQGWLGFPETIQCFANNSLGSVSITLEAPQNSIIIYIGVASAVAFVLVTILVFIMRRRCGKRATQQSVMKNKQIEMKTTQNKSDLENKEAASSDEDIYTNCPDSLVYDNCGCDVKPFSSDRILEYEAIYSNM